jgi:hypothetical protein
MDPREMTSSMKPLSNKEMWFVQLIDYGMLCCAIGSTVPNVLKDKNFTATRL